MQAFESLLERKYIKGWVQVHSAMKIPWRNSVTYKVGSKTRIKLSDELRIEEGMSPES